MILSVTHEERWMSQMVLNYKASSSLDRTAGQASSGTRRGTAGTRARDRRNRG
jgi:hypothetical protein